VQQHVLASSYLSLANRGLDIIRSPRRTQALTCPHLMDKDDSNRNGNLSNACNVRIENNAS
jgi:hypothetical protein